MKLQAVMETLLQRQQRARQELEARQPPPPEAPAGRPARARVPSDEDRDPEDARMQRAQMAALAAMRAAAAGLGPAPSPGGSEDGPPGSEDEDTAQEGVAGSPGQGREVPGLAEGDGHLDDLCSDDDLKPKWEEEEEEELEEDLGDGDEDGDEDEDEEDYEDEEGLGPPGSTGLGHAALLPRKAPPPQAFRGGDGGPRVPGGQERAGAGPAHPGGAAHVAPQLQPPDHGDWTYEEQFKQVGRVSSWGHDAGRTAVARVLLAGPGSWCLPSACVCAEPGTGVPWVGRAGR